MTLSSVFFGAIHLSGGDWVQYDNETAPFVAWGTLAGNTYTGSQRVWLIPISRLMVKSSDYDSVFEIDGPAGLPTGHIDLTLTISSLPSGETTSSAVRIDFPSSYSPVYDSWSNDANLFEIIDFSDRAGSCGGNALPYTTVVVGDDFSPTFPMYFIARYIGPNYIDAECALQVNPPSGNIGFVATIDKIEWVSSDGTDRTTLYATDTKTDYITVFGEPAVDFSGTPTSGNVALSVDFTDLSTNDPTSWLWDFGDGGSSTNQDPTYVYNYTGVYTVTLTATNSDGSGSETKIAYITVTAIAEYGAAVIENCDIDTGGLAVGLRVADVAIARDNRLGSVTIDASAELRVKDNSYNSLANSGLLTQLVGDNGFIEAYSTTAINLPLTDAHFLIVATAACTITLPDSIGRTGREYIIKATADSVLVNTTSSQTIDGDTSKTLNTYDCLVVISNGANWLIG